MSDTDPRPREDPAHCFEKCHCTGDDYLWDPTCERCRVAGCGEDTSDKACRLRSRAVLAVVPPPQEPPGLPPESFSNVIDPKPFGPEALQAVHDRLAFEIERPDTDIGRADFERRLRRARKETT